MHIQNIFWIFTKWLKISNEPKNSVSVVLCLKMALNFWHVAFKEEFLIQKHFSWFQFLDGLSFKLCHRDNNKKLYAVAKWSSGTKFYMFGPNFQRLDKYFLLN